MKKYKKIIILFISFLTLNNFCYNVRAFKYINKNDNKFYDEENKVKRKDIKTKSVKEQKGFIYSMSIKRPKGAPGNFIDVVNKYFMYIFSNRTPYTEKKGVNIKSFFRNCDYIYNEDSYYSDQFVFSNNKESLERLKYFYKNSMADRNFSRYFDEYDFFNNNYNYNNDKDKITLNKDKYEEFLKSYCDRLFEKLRNFSLLLKKIYDKKDFEKLEKILKFNYKDTSHGENILSFMNQSKNVKKIIKAMLKNVEHKKEEKKQINTLKKKKGFDDDYEDDLNDDYYDDDFFYGYKYNSDKIYKKILNQDDDDFEDLDYNLRYINKYDFRRCLDIYYKLGLKNIRNLKKITFDDFKESIKSIDFKNNIKSVVRKVEEISGTIETLEKK